MSETTVHAGGHADPQEPADDETTDRHVPAGSVLGRLRQDRDRQRQRTALVLPVGRSEVLAARYRPLDDDEIADITKRVTGQAKKRRRVGKDEESDGSDEAALTLSIACIELLYVGADGKVRPLVEALQEDDVDTEGDDPLRYNRRLVRVLDLDDLAEDASSVEVVQELHRWRDGERSNLIPLVHAASEYAEWLNGEGDEDLEELLEGK